MTEPAVLLSVLIALASACFAAPPAQGQFRPAITRVELDRDRVQPGGAITVSMTWANAGTEPARSDYRVFVHPRLIGRPEDGSYAMFGADHDLPVETYRWTPGCTVQDTAFAVTVPPNAPTGTYVLLVGLFDAKERCALANADLESREFGGFRYEVARFEVTPEPGAPHPVARELMAAPVSAVSASRSGAAGEQVALKCGQWTAHLDDALPVIRRIGLGGKDQFGGAEAEDAPVVELCRTGDGARSGSYDPAVRVAYGRKAATGSTMAYAATVTWDGKPAASFVVALTGSASGVAVDVRDVKEEAGYHLLSIAWPNVVALDSTVPGAALVSPIDAGRLIPIVESAPRRQMLGMDWFTQSMVTMIQRQGAVAVLEPRSIEDILRVQIAAASADAKTGVLGVRLVHRLDAKSPERQIVADSRMGYTLALSAGPNAGWVSAAKAFRARYKGDMAAAYRHSLVYKIFCDEPHSPQAITTFEQAGELIRRIAALTGGVHQIAYLVGWQHKGHDTGYPSVSVVNERLGGLDGLKKLIEDGRKVNATVSAHDNYDDAYLDSPAWDEGIVARGMDGELMKGGVWAGGQSYIVGAAKYAASGKAQARVNGTLDRCPFRESYHIDVLSAVPLRYDFDAEHPAAAEANLAGKIAVVKAFNARGADVTSEGFTQPFVGAMTYFWNLQRRPDQHFAGEQRIPLAPFMYHGAAGYGGGINTDADILNALLYGGNWSEDLTTGTPLDRILDRIYFVNLPWQALNTRRMQSYEAKPDGTQRVGYGADTYVEVNVERNTYRVVVDGREISTNFRTVVPAGAGKWLAYSREAGPIALPSGAAHAYRLSPDGARTQVAIAGGKLQAEARTPYLVTGR